MLRPLHLLRPVFYAMTQCFVRTYPLQEVTGGAGDQSPEAAAAGRSCGRPEGPSYRRRPAVPAAWPACGAHRGGTRGAARP
jgi:hypothetical protein